MCASRLEPETISDAEAAARLGFPLRTIRTIIDREGLCLRAGRRRRLTSEQFEMLIAALTPKPRSIRDIGAEDALARALKLAQAAAPSKRSRFR